MPTVPNVTGISAYGPSATLFTITSDYKVQQYDLIGQDAPILVAQVSHFQTVGANDEVKGNIMKPEYRIEARSDTEDDEAASMPSALQKISRTEQVAKYDDEERDKLGPLSPASSRASASSASSYGRRHRNVPRYATPGSDVTVFSNAPSTKGKSNFSNRDRAAHSGSAAAAPSVTRSSALRQEILRSPENARRVKDADLFPHIRARLAQVQLKIPQTGQDMTVTDLQKEMLSVIFDWPESITSLLRFERKLSHQPLFSYFDNCIYT